MDGVIDQWIRIETRVECQQSIENQTFRQTIEYFFTYCRQEAKSSSSDHVSSSDRKPSGTGVDFLPGFKSIVKEVFSNQRLHSLVELAKVINSVSTSKALQLEVIRLNES